MTRRGPDPGGSPDPRGSQTLSNLRYDTNPLATGAWQVSTWDAGQSSILKWSGTNWRTNSTPSLRTIGRII